MNSKNYLLLSLAILTFTFLPFHVAKAVHPFCEDDHLNFVFEFGWEGEVSDYAELVLTRRIVANEAQANLKEGCKPYSREDYVVTRKVSQPGMSALPVTRRDLVKGTHACSPAGENIVYRLCLHSIDLETGNDEIIADLTHHVETILDPEYKILNLVNGDLDVRSVLAGDERIYFDVESRNFNNAYIVCYCPKSPENRKPLLQKARTECRPNAQEKALENGSKPFLDGLENGVTYEVAVRGVDRSGNRTPYSKVYEARPIRSFSFTDLYDGTPNPFQFNW